MRDTYYSDKRKLFPPSYEREEGKDYSKYKDTEELRVKLNVAHSLGEGAVIYNLATPIKS